MRFIGLDLDGTICNSPKAVLSLIEKDYGITGSMENWVNYDLVHNEPFKSLKSVQVLEAFGRIWDNWMSIELEDPQVPRIVSRLRSMFGIRILTVSPGSQKDIGNWLRLNRVEYDGFTKVNRSADKAAVEVELYIDDNGKVAHACSAAGKTVVLLRKAWNEEFIKLRGEDTRIKVAENWQHVEHILVKEYERIANESNALMRRPLYSTRSQRRRH